MLEHAPEAYFGWEGMFEDEEDWEQVELRVRWNDQARNASRSVLAIAWARSMLCQCMLPQQFLYVLASLE